MSGSNAGRSLAYFRLSIKYLVKFKSTSLLFHRKFQVLKFYYFRPEDGVTEGAPWTDKRADLYLKRYFSVGNQKMLLQNKVDRLVGSQDLHHKNAAKSRLIALRLYLQI